MYFFERLTTTVASRIASFLITSSSVIYRALCFIGRPLANFTRGRERAFNLLLCCYNANNDCDLREQSRKRFLPDISGFRLS